jgi:hypothetical protein
MGCRADAAARAILSFVDNPVTELVKGSALLAIGLSDALGDSPSGRCRAEKAPAGEADDP